MVEVACIRVRRSTDRSQVTDDAPTRLVMTAVAAPPSPSTVQSRPDGSRSRLDAAVRLVAGVLLWAALLLVGYWWAAGGGLQDLLTFSTALDSVGRLTGLIASVLLLAQVLLMARVPTLEHAFGQ